MTGPSSGTQPVLRFGMKGQAHTQPTGPSLFPETSMRAHIIPLLATTILTAGAVLSGCASTATGLQTSSFTSAGPETQLTQVAPAGTVLAVVRYPAFIEADDEEAFSRAYVASAIGGSGADFDPVDSRSLAQSMVLKSNYFAMSLYRELAARLPEHSVLLSPHRIYEGDDGTLTSEPITQAESIASVVTVDFTAYSYPDIEKMMGDKPLTFGDLVTPLVTVRTDPRASVSTEGVLLASSPLIGAASGASYGLAIDDASEMQSGRLTAGTPELDLISYMSGTPPMDPAITGLAGYSTGAVRAYPIEKIKLDPNTLATLDRDKDDILEAPFTDGFINQVIDLINRTDATKASMLRRAEAISDYDEGLAALSFVGDNAPDYQARLRYAERLLEAEQKYLSVQSLRLYDGVINGEMGALVRDMLQEEHYVLERRREIARQQNMATAAAFLAAIGGVAMASQDNQSFGDRLATQAMIQGAIFAATEAMRQNQLSKGVGTNYMESMVPALSSQTEIQIDLIDSNETITAIRFEDLKDKLSELYAENQRSLDTVATRCTYAGGSEPGTWLGACENGLANGAGVGVFRNEYGDLVEHYGYARNGLADGPGYRIVRAGEGSFSIEGNFSGGNANGVARVERSGSVALRRFREGQDMGAAPAGSMNASPFDRGVRTG